MQQTWYDGLTLPKTLPAESQPSRLVAEVMSELNQLLGVWRGNGHGQFPTIDQFAYTEELRFESNGLEPWLHYEQRTWKTDSEGKIVEPLHWESGFIMPTEGGHVDWLNAQASRRIEVLQGQLTPAPRNEDQPFLILESALLGYDERMRQTRRTIFLCGNEMRYTMDMATNKASILQRHLDGHLGRAV